MSYAVIIPAAGSGSRMGAAVPKVLLTLQAADSSSSHQGTILTRTINVFVRDPHCALIVVCVPPGTWRECFEQTLESYPTVRLVDGGSTRQESVRNAVEYIATSVHLSDETCVLVHDAARCCVGTEVIQRVVDGVRAYGAVTAAVRVVDSLCRAASSAVIDTYVSRENLWAIQTPQGFLMKDLRTAHCEAATLGIEALDDAGLVARIRPVHMVEGDRFNIKVTEPADLITARRVLDCAGYAEQDDVRAAVVRV